jgi:MFS family permease
VGGLGAPAGALSMPEAPSSPARGLTPTEWLICVAACIGFAFDTYEILVLPLIVRPAIVELAGLSPGSPEFNRWVGLLFFVPFLFGGLFGLLGGYLTDRLGRRRVLVWSILLYAASASGAACSTSLPALLVLRCTTIIGVCVEFVAAVAWLAELFPSPKQREAVLGYTQASSALGGFMVAAAYYLAATFGDRLPPLAGGHETWRYTVLAGTIPALPLIVLRPFLPESPMWRGMTSARTLAPPSIAELFRPDLRRTSLTAAMMVACSYAITFGATMHVQRIAPDLPRIRALPRMLQDQAIGGLQFVIELGNLAGRILLAWLVVRTARRRRLVQCLMVLGSTLIPFVFVFMVTGDLTLLKAGVFLATMLASAQFSFWGNYLPRVFPTHLRGTGQSFAANIGGRIAGTSAALATTQMVDFMPGATPSLRLAYAAALVAGLAQIGGLVASRWLPEPKGEQLPT